MRPGRGVPLLGPGMGARLSTATVPPPARITPGGSSRRITARAGLAILTLLLVLGAGGCAGKTEAELAGDFLQQGLDAHRAGDLVAAEKDYREVLKHDPQNKYAYYNLGVIAQAQGNAADAENDYRVALTLDPDFLSPLFNLAILRAAADDVSGAIDLYRHALAVDASYAAAHFNLGLLLRRAGQAAAGDAEVRAAIKLDPSLVDPAAGSQQPSAAPSAAAPGGASASP